MWRYDRATGPAKGKIGRIRGTPRYMFQSVGGEFPDWQVGG